MDSKEDLSDGAGGVIAGEFPSDLLQGILPPPPPPPAWTFVTNDDDDATPPPLDIVDPEAVQPPSSAASEAADGALVEELVVNASTASTGLADAGVPTTEVADVDPADMVGLLPARAALLLGTAAADAVDAASRRAPPPPPPPPPPAGEVEAGWSLPPAAVGIRRPSDDPPPSTSNARPPPKHEDIVRPATFDARDDGREEEKMEESEDDDEAPRPPEMVAAAFEEAKPGLIDDDGYAPAPPGQIAALFEGYDGEEEEREEGEDDEAPPLPPDMVAASYEAGYGHEEEKREDEGEDDEAPLPPEIIVSSFEGHSYEEEEKREEGDDDEAPRPPSMVAASWEEIDAADDKATKEPPLLIEDGVDPQVPGERNDGAPVTTGNRERLFDPSSSSNQTPSTASSVQVDAPSITPTPQRGDQRSMGLAANDHGHVGMTTRTTEESMSPPRPSFDRSHQSVPLIEATLVQDVPQEPVYIYINTNSGEGTVYDAFPMSDTQDNDVHGWSRISFKFRVIMLGLVLVAVAAIIGVVVVIAGNKKEPSIAPTKEEAGINASVPPVSTSIWKKQGSAIVGDAAEDYLGASVALSADAKTLVVGAPGVNYEDIPDKKGYVKVYRMTDDGGSRTQLGQTIYGNATGDQFGYSVDVTAQGNVILLGSPGEWGNNDRPGYVQVFSLDSDDETAGTTGTWKQVGQDIAGEAIGNGFGQSVSISEDGKTIAVGARSNYGKNGGDSGHVRIYRLADDGASWEQIGEDIDGDAAGDLWGRSVSLSANGTIVAIGAVGAGIDGLLATGQVKVYRIDIGGSSWEQLGESIYGDNEYDYFGYSVDISPDGNSLAVGTYVSVGPGYVKVFSLEDGGVDDDDDLGASSWKQVGLTITGEANGDLFGYSVSLSDDAKTLAVGAPYANEFDSGHVRVYRTDDSESGWTKIVEDIDGEAADDNSGGSVSLSGDGKTVAIGSSENGDNGVNSGHVRVFVAE